MKELRPAKQRQSRLAELTGIPQATISAIENGRVDLGVERAKVFARALRCHPAVLGSPAGRFLLSPPRRSALRFRDRIAHHHPHLGSAPGHYGRHQTCGARARAGTHHATRPAGRGPAGRGSAHR